MQRYHNLLLKKKGQFGIVWLAAHHPSKVSKTEIVQLDLSKKCEDILEFIVNGKENRPRFSLLISSHLMYGLVVLLNKKHIYLLDEVKHLKAELSVSYVQLMKKTKAPKKVVNADRSAITLKENLPDDLDVSALLERIDPGREAAVRGWQRHTLDETDDAINRSTLIPIDIDMNLETFGVDQSMHGGLDMSVDFGGHTDFSMIGVFNNEYLEKTAIDTAKDKKKRTTFATPNRMPLVELSTNNQLTRPEVGVSEQTPGTIFENPTAAAVDQSTMLEHNFAMPLLYEETMLQEQPADQTLVSAMQPEEVGPVNVEMAPLDATLVAQEEMQPEVERTEQVVTASPRRNVAVRKAPRGPIVDYRTEISDAEIKKRLMPMKSRKASEELGEEMPEAFLDQIHNMRTKQNASIFNTVNLMKEPIGRLARHASYIFESEARRNLTMQHRLMLTLKCLTSCKQPDDKHFYLTDTDIEPGLPFFQDNEAPQQSKPAVDETIGQTTFGNGLLSETGTMIEKGRLARDSLLPSRTSQVASEGPASNLRKRAGSSIFNQIDVSREILQENTPQIEQQPPMEHYGEMPPPMMPIFDATMEVQQHQEQVGDRSNTFWDNNTTNSVSDLNDYETILLKELHATGSCILQKVIATAQLTERCKIAQKPRRLFAAKMFAASLNLLGKATIEADQSNSYGPIEISQTY